MRTRLALWLVALSSIGAAALSNPAAARDWHQWRGPEQNGVSREKNLPETWTPEGENLLWSAPYGGMSSPIVMRGKVYLLSRVGERKDADTISAGPLTQETVVCLDAVTGQKVWEHPMNMTQTEVPVHRLGWSNPTGDPATGRVYVFGSQCNLVCFDGATGKVLWQRQMTEEFGLISTFGGRTPSPAIDEDQVFIAGVAFGWGDNARAQYRVFALNKDNGELNWTTGTGGLPVDSPYQTPTVTVINGHRQLVIGSGDGGVYGFQPRTGKKLWAYQISKRGINANPLVDGSRVYIATGEVNFDNSGGGTVRCIDVATGKPEEVWRRDGIEAGFSAPTLLNGMLYVMDNSGKVHAMDAGTGKAVWKRTYSAGTIGKAGLVAADGKLYIGEANGRFSIIRPAKDKPEVLSKVEITGNAQQMGREFMIFGSVAIANGRVYVPTAQGVFCIGPKDVKVSEDPLPEPPKESADGDRKPTVLQVVPADIVLKPGEKRQFSVRLFDALGRWSMPAGKLPPIDWSIGQLTLPPPPRPASQPATAPAPPPTLVGNLKGAVAPDGAFTAEAGPHQGGGVFAKSGDLTGFTRVRVIPPLPWNFDFTATPAGVPPLTWLGAGGKFWVSELEGEKVLTKIPQVDLYYRARTNFGTPGMANYTIQADVRAGEVVVRDQDGHEQHYIPDPGVINQRYVLTLYGSHQLLEIHAWAGALPTQLSGAGALHKRIPFAWKANTWYRLKLRVDQVGDKAFARGKAWPAGAQEPEQWNIELEDPLPNRSGNPGLFGHSLVTPFKSPIHYDNILVTGNQ